MPEGHGASSQSVAWPAATEATQGPPAVAGSRLQTTKSTVLDQPRVASLKPPHWVALSPVVLTVSLARLSDPDLADWIDQGASNF